METPAPIFEETTSPLERSNDGNLYLRRDAGGFMLTAEHGPGRLDRGHTVLFTFNRIIADAFIAGYDLAKRPIGSVFLDPVVEDGDEVEGVSVSGLHSVHHSLHTDDPALD